MSNQHSNVIKGLKWSIIDQFGLYGLKLCFSIVIARLLSPSDYGLIGMAAIFIAVSSQLTDAGFQTALIQKKETDNNDYSTVFSFNILVSTLLYVILFICSPFISEYYNQPILENIIKITGLNVVLNALSGVQTVILIKKLNFKTQAKINFIATVLSGLICIIAALSNFGVWALILQTLSGSLIKVLLYFYHSEWIPKIRFYRNSFKSLFSFGSKIFLQGFIDNIFSNIYYPLIGKNYNIIELGNYTKAKGFTDLYTNQISLAISRVAFPAFSNINDDLNQLTLNYKKAKNIMLVLFTFLTCILLPLIAPVIDFLLTPKWSGIIPFMQILIFDAVVYPFYRLNINIIEAQGKSNVSLILEVFKKGLMFTILIFTLKTNVNYIIYGYLLASFCALILSWFFTKNIIQIKEQIRGHLLLILLAIPSLLVYFLFFHFLKNVYTAGMFSMITSIFYFLLLFRYSKIKAIYDAKSFTYKFIRK